TKPGTPQAEVTTGTGPDVGEFVIGPASDLIVDGIRVSDSPIGSDPLGGGGNTAPTISDIVNQTINEDATTGALAFTVGDAEPDPGLLTLSGTSSNHSLVPDGNVVFGGSGANRTVTVTPLANQFGSATITVTVSDGSLTASDTFLLTVNPV